MTETIHVIATTLDGTEGALRAAIPAAIRHEARVVLLVPKAVPHDGEGAVSATMAMMARCDDMVKKFNHPVQVRLCMTQRVSTEVTRLIPDRALVFVGGAAQVWWPSAEQRLAARLRRSGRAVVFVGCNGGRARTKTGVLSHA